MAKQAKGALVDPVRNGRRFLIGFYTLFAISAGVRAVYQLATKGDQAPLAYGLSTLAALIYLVACIGLNRHSPTAWRVTVALCSFELLGVLLVGSATLLRPTLFADQTVWSVFGQGYAYVPLVLPVLGLLWLTRPATRRAYGLFGVD
ncbi:MAG: hypothetical protein M3Q45_12415 [Chloroflexota bacterium]|nr:hypothetical protein [Chloroflexota bacterium]